MQTPLNIVFDFGAVLFHWEPARLVQEFFPQHCTSPQAAQALGKEIFSHPDWWQFDRGTMALHDVVDRTTTRLRLPSDAVQALMHHLGERLQPIADNVHILQNLCKHRDAGQCKLYFLSNMPEPYARVLEQRHAFIGWFDGGVFSGDVKLAKPEPAIFAHIAQRFSLQPQRTVFIDDHAANIAAANTFGWQALHLPQPDGLGALLQQHARLDCAALDL
jgi:putative hydrolase of the HAD superfamily